MAVEYNLALDGIPSGTINKGTGEGAVSNINDNNEGTWFGCYVNAANYKDYFDYICEVVIDNSHVSRVEIRHSAWMTYDASYDAGQANWYLDVYYDGAYHQVKSGNWGKSIGGDVYGTFDTTDVVEINQDGVTRLRLRASGWAEPPHFSPNLKIGHRTKELRLVLVGEVPEVETLQVIVDGNDVKFRGQIIHDGYLDCEGRIAYRKSGEAWSYSDWMNSLNTGDIFEVVKSIEEFEYDIEYEVLAQARNEVGSSSGEWSEYYMRISIGRRIALLGDLSSHGGTIVTHNQDGTLKVGGIEVAVEGAQHQCPISEHGTTPISAVTTRSYHNGKLILTWGAVAGCGAVIIPPDRNVYVE